MYISMYVFMYIHYIYMYIYYIYVYILYIYMYIYDNIIIDIIIYI
jgi:hypothetical protein